MPSQVSSRRRVLLAFLGALAAARMAPKSARAADEPPVFLYFWAVGCPHCARAKPFVKQLEREHRDVSFEWYEVKKDPAGRRRFAREVKRLGIEKPGVPAFICGGGYVLGWVGKETRLAVRALLKSCHDKDHAA